MLSVIFRPAVLIVEEDLRVHEQRAEEPIFKTEQRLCHFHRAGILCQIIRVANSFGKCPISFLCTEIEIGYIGLLPLFFLLRVYLAGQWVCFGGLRKTRRIKILDPFLNALLLGNQACKFCRIASSFLELGYFIITLLPRLPCDLTLHLDVGFNPV